MTLLAELAEPQDVITRLNTQWDIITTADAIAKPTFKEGFVGEITTDGNTILVGWSQIPMNFSNRITLQDEINNLFEIAISSDHNTETTAKTNLIKMLSQVRRHINRFITNGEWHVDLAIPTKHGHEQLFICSVRQTLYHNLPV